MKLDDRSEMPIGSKYKGVHMEKVPARYLLWYWEECGLWDRSKIYSEEYFAVHDYIKERFSSLQEECPDYIVNHKP
jgi:hypothetical protein